jgi:hypothetical protein
MVLAGKLHIVHMNGRARAAVRDERYVEMGLKFLGGYGGITGHG